MEIKRVALVLVDISGYTSFMKMHTMSMLHAEAIITDLLEAVIDNAEYPLTLSKLEGDAAFFYATLEEADQQARTAAQSILQQVSVFFDAFQRKERQIVACDTCQCDACQNIGKLKLKAFLHAGQAVFKQIKQFEELAGEDVILIHRLLKNSVPSNEYILLTDAYTALGGGLSGYRSESRTEDCEGIGQVGVQVYYLPEADPLPVPPPPSPPMPGTEVGEMAARWNEYAVKRIKGEIPRPDFKHLPNVDRPVNRWHYFFVGVSGNILATIRHRLGMKV
jgi:hypothetical protein